MLFHTPVRTIQIPAVIVPEQNVAINEFQMLWKGH